jgi:RNA polymerase sigma-70 factor (ECF subfamily)
MEQLSYEEVARVMDVPVGTVRSRLHSARERFRALWLAANEQD